MKSQFPADAANASKSTLDAAAEATLNAATETALDAADSAAIEASLPNSPLETADSLEAANSTL
jgi:hypothetical protein